jgi:tRNA(fMet)-specific endonuclease VapC
VTELYLLDTNALSEPLRPAPNQTFLDTFQQYARELATAAPVLHEMGFGCLRLPASRRRTAIERFI